MKKVLWVVIALFSTSVAADQMQVSLNNLCKKIQHCAMSQAGGVTNKEMQALLQPMLNAMCTQMEQSYTTALAEQPQLKDEAIACVKSLDALSCADLLNNDSPNITKACESYKKKASAASRE